MKLHFAKILQKIEETFQTSSDQLFLLTQVAQLLHEGVDHYDWVGFYILDPESNVLFLGPFVGAPTEHTHIPVGKGICGQVAESKKKMVIQDVSNQDNYLSCSLHVQSEIVIPILKNGQFVAEIDIDSHAYAPFTIDDELFLEAIALRLASLF